MSNAPFRTAVWSIIELRGGGVQHVRIPVAVVITTPERVLLGLG